MLDGLERRPVRLIGAGIYNLTPEAGRQLTFEDIDPERAAELQQERQHLLDRLQQRYGLDFAGHLEDIFRGETLHRTAEYMRKHYHL